MRIVFLIVLLFPIALRAQTKGATAVQVGDTSEKVFVKVEVEASVDAELWIVHLTRHLQSPIKKAARKGMKVGQYMVQVRFLVEKDGSINDVQALNDPGYGLAAAAVKALKTGPKWKPGEQDGRKVRSYHTQPITFIIQEE